MIYFLRDGTEAEKHIFTSERNSTFRPVGCGKTSLMNIIRMFQKPEERFLIKSCRDLLRIHPGRVLVIQSTASCHSKRHPPPGARRLGNRKQPKVLRQRLQRHGRNIFQVRSESFLAVCSPISQPISTAVRSRSYTAHASVVASANNSTSSPSAIRQKTKGFKTLTLFKIKSIFLVIFIFCIIG